MVFFGIDVASITGDLPPRTVTVKKMTFTFNNVLNSVCVKYKVTEIRNLSYRPINISNQCINPLPHNTAKDI